MRFAAVSMSDIINANRWDAGFHIALKDLRGRIVELQSVFSAEEVISKLKDVDTTTKQCLAPLSTRQRYSRAKLTSGDTSAICETYPFLALALVEENANAAIVRLREQIAIDEAHLEAVLSLTERQPEEKVSPSKPAYVMRAN